MNKSQVIIGIDGSRAFLKRRTGIEEYSYQVICHLRSELTQEHVILYIRADQNVDFALPSNWRVKKLWAPRLWTQVRLSLEMLLHRPDVLFVPAHTVPLIHPKNTVVVIHGLEYEICPRSYSWWSRVSMRIAIRFSCRVARAVICVSENTKRDVMRLYETPSEKIRVIYEGYLPISRMGFVTPSLGLKFKQKVQVTNLNLQKAVNTRAGIFQHLQDDRVPYILFIGRLEERKNIVRCIQAFKMAKEQYHIPHKLVLAGKPGYGYEKIKIAMNNYQSPTNDIIELDYVSEEEKWELLRHADIFFFATLYEGFGIPVLEAQSVGVPVITSNASSLPEVAGEGAILVDPTNVEEIAEAIKRLVSDNALKSDIIRKGLENVKRFSWEQCAHGVGVVLKRQ
jgi:glycosyltransferase involved in cell wall biosynthesis